MSQIDKWAQLAKRWHEQGPPATPSADDLDHFVAALRQHAGDAHLTVGILGCTPSLRTKVHQELPEASVLLIDFSREMYQVTSSVVDDEVKSHESYLAINWLAMAAHLSHEVDAFVGDKSLDNVALEDWGDFFRSAAESLRPGGLLVLHVGFPDPRLAGKSFDLLAAPWLRRMTQEEGSLEYAAAGLWEDLLSGSARNETPHHLSLEPYRDDLIRHSSEQTPLGTLAARVLADFAGKLDARWTRFDKSDVVSAAASAGFSFVHEAFSSDYVAARNQPILSFRIA